MLPGNLVSALKSGRCVAYVGAGMSAACGMPNWHELLLRLREVARANQRHNAIDDYGVILRNIGVALRARRFPLAASLIRRVLTPGEIDEVIREAFGSHVLSSAPNLVRRRMTDRLDSLINAPFRGIVTTNYDTLIEDRIGMSSTRRVQIVMGESRLLGSVLMNESEQTGFFVKLHGSLSTDDIVLSQEEYDAIYLNSSKVKYFLNALLMKYRVLFVGCSLEDSVTRMRADFWRQFSGTLPTWHALLEDTAVNRSKSKRLFAECGVECILYRNADGSHAGVDKFLRRLTALS